MLGFNLAYSQWLTIFPSKVVILFAIFMFEVSEKREGWYGSGERGGRGEGRRRECAIADDCYPGFTITARFSGLVSSSHAESYTA